MTFMGSTSNDSAFNAWVTDVTTTKNRATVESVLSLLPIAAMGAVIVFAGFIEVITYQTFFVVLGIIVILAGIIGLFTLTDSRNGEKKDDNYFQNLIYGFKPSVIKENSKLYISLTAVCIYSVAVQVWFPYILIYLEHSLGLNIDNLMEYITTPVLIAAPFAIVAIVGFIIIMGKVIDKHGKDKLVFVAAILFCIGLVAAFFAHKLSTFFIAAIPLFAGYGLIGIMLNATVRDYTPEDKTGLFQGVRMIFSVLIPMVVGPYIGDLTCSLSKSGQYIDETGNLTYSPCAEMFLAAAVVVVFIFIPLVILKKKGFVVEEK